ncbi:MAG: phosphatase PAP2 family protein [Clostridia bacterium]|nr:phosphatase PAP2 family protein [Clostridia bacterium]
MDINILLALQDFRNGVGGILTDFLNKMTFLGELNTALVIMALVYWSVDKSLGTYLMMGWSGNRLVNGVLKVTACAYRPWIRDSRIIPYGNSITTATGYSFPSGHTMNATSIFGGLAVRGDMPGVLRITAGLIVLLVGFSRNFLGVHTPQDVLVGMILGSLVLALVYRLMNWVDKNPGKDWLVAAVGLVLAIAVAVYAAVKPYPMDYDAEGKLLVDGAKMANDTFKGCGWCIAFLVGWVMERRFAGFSTDVPLKQKLTRAAAGILSYYAVSLILVPLVKNGIGGPAGTMISCFLQVFYVVFIFPWILTKTEKSAAV